MEVTKQGKHYVLVHGMGHGAWCWYKLIPLLKKAGHRVTALDMSASGINLKKIEEVHTLEQYSQPLLDFMASLADTETVVLVGHSLGGMNLALAMEYFPRKVSAAVFVIAFVPDTINQPSYVVDKLDKAEGAWLDSQTWTYGPPEEPLTAVQFSQQLMQSLYRLSPVEDLELAMALKRPGSLLAASLAKAKKFTNDGYGSVRRVFLICKKDELMTEEFARWMIGNSGVTEIKEIEDADHMPMFSQPQRLCDCLVQISDP
ncbi:hypothetical protein RND81_11G221100 [Saponaria officinalis]|uniref:AB hydrolase-1 domain-containing protein n=1 Tax=Saponaria officinalis TaxID=3572 RepID=A0AAW1HQ07_SAPOF